MLPRSERDPWTRLFYQPYATVVPWAGLVGLLGLAWAGLHLLVLDHYREVRGLLQQQRGDVRVQLSRHAEARQARQDMLRVLAMLPAQRDFAPLALGLTEQAKSHRVRLPGLTYQVEKTEVSDVYRAVLEGDATGLYEDLRRFIHSLETAEELVLIEHLDVDRAGRSASGMTMRLRIVTYLRAPVKSAATP